MGVSYLDVNELDCTLETPGLIEFNGDEARDPYIIAGDNILSGDSAEAKVDAIIALSLYVDQEYGWMSDYDDVLGKIVRGDTEKKCFVATDGGWEMVDVSDERFDPKHAIDVIRVDYL